MFPLPRLIKRWVLIQTLKKWSLNACPGAFTHPCHHQECRKHLPWSKGAAWWHLSHGPVQWLSKAATKKTKSKWKILPYNYLKAHWFGVKMQQRLFSHPPAPAETHGNPCGTPRAKTWERIWIPRALLSITDNSLSYQLQQGITKDDILKKGNRQMCLFLLITHFWRWHTMDSNWNNKMHSNILYCIDYLMVSS